MARPKKALKQRRTLVFLDQSGLSEQPQRVRTWASRGQTPVSEFNFSWARLSAIAGLTPRPFYFQLHRGAIRAEEVVGFLRHLRRRCPALIASFFRQAGLF